MDTLLNRLKNEILKTIQDEGGISSGVSAEDVEGIFEDMIEDAIFKETHTDLTIHLQREYLYSEEYISENYPLILDNMIEVTPNTDGDYVFEDVIFGTHTLEVYSPEEYLLLDENLNDTIDEVIVTKQKNEFTVILDHQATTQQEI